MKARVNDIQRHTAYDVTAVVCKMLGDVTVDEVYGRTRIRRLATARHLVAWVLYRLYLYTTTEIGTLTKRDHTTILHSVARVDEWLSVPNCYKREVEIVEHFVNTKKETTGQS